MNVITSEKQVSLISSQIDRTVDTSKTLPDMVFRRAFKYFSFITFDEPFLPIFFNSMQQFLVQIREEQFWLAAINLNKKRESKRNFKITSAIQVLATDSEKDYLSAVNGFTGDGAVSANMHYSDVLIAISLSQQWVIFGDSGADIAVCAFSNSTYFNVFTANYGAERLTIYGTELLGIERAADHAYGVTGNLLQKEKFFSNYS